MNVPYAHEKNEYFAVGGCGVLQMAVRSGWLIMFQVFCIYINFYLFVLSITQKGVIKPTVLTGHLTFPFFYLVFVSSTLKIKIR